MIRVPRKGLVALRFFYLKECQLYVIPSELSSAFS